MEKTSSNIFELLDTRLLKVIREFGYITPTKTQEKAIPPILEGKNVLLIAPTGSGKTEAAFFPILSKLINMEKTKGIQAIYITPLRALNRDVLRRMVNIADKLNIRIEVRHGDTPTTQRRKQAIKPPHILITTPETLQAILPGKIMKKHLSNVQWVIIDEIHDLAVDKRGTQLALALERLIEICGKEFQRIGLSATIGSPHKVASFLGGNKRKVTIINVTAIKNFEIKVDIAKETSDDESIAEKLEITSSMAAKIRKIIEIAPKYRSILIFTNTREMAETLASRIRLLKTSFKIGVHHSSLSREERLRVENQFKQGKIKILICTSSLELGIDIGTVDFVIQYMSPRQVTNLIQRVGRAGHKLWETSKGLILSSNIDDILESAVLAKKAMKRELEEIEIHESAYDVLAHQMVGLLLDKGKIELNYALEVFKRAHPYRNLTIEELKEIASLLAEIKIVRFEAIGEGVLRTRGKRTWKYYYENLSMIPDVRRFLVINILNRKPIGTLDEEFIVIHGTKENPFILAGRTWKIVHINEEELKVFVEPVQEELGAIPAWIGELIPVPFQAAQEAGRLRKEIMKESNPPEYPLTERALEKAREQLKEHIKYKIPLPTDREILIEKLGKIVIIHTCLGTKTNRTLATLIGHELTKRLRTSVRVNSDPYRILLILPLAIKMESIKKILQELLKDEEEVIEAIKKSEAYKWKLYHVAKRFGIISREAKIAAIRRIIPMLSGTIVEREALRETLQDYFNINALRKYLEKISKDEVKIIFHEATAEGASPLAYPILYSTLPYELIPPRKAMLTLAQLIKNRLLDKEVRLICFHCLQWQTIRKIKYLPEEIRCPKCNAKAIGMAKISQTRLIKTLRKWKRGLKLKSEEYEEVEEFRKTVGLIMSYGKKAIIAMSARGIGPTVAARILRKFHKNEDDFYLDILEAEKEYLRTRPYWE